MSMFPFPYVVSMDEIPKSGSLVRTPKFCFIADKSKCRKYYESIADQPGPHECPYGFSSYTWHNRHGVTILSGLRIVGYEDRRALKSRISHTEYAPRFPLAVVDSTVGRFKPEFEVVKETELKLEKMQSALDDIESRNRIQTDFSTVVLHDVRKLNAQLKSQTELLINKGSEIEPHQLHYRVNNIFATSTLISTRLDAYDFETNPTLAVTGNKRLAGIYRKFEKSSHCLQVAQARNNVKIQLAGQSYREVEIYSVFDLLPFALLENALKYSPNDQTVQVNFEEYRRSILVTVSSIGPLATHDELESIFDRGFRGQHARKVNDGTGIGLYLAKKIADLHECDIEVSSEDSALEIDQVPYGRFTVAISVPC